MNKKYFVYVISSIFVLSILIICGTVYINKSKVNQEKSSSLSNSSSNEINIDNGESTEIESNNEELSDTEEIVNNTNQTSNKEVESSTLNTSENKNKDMSSFPYKVPNSNISIEKIIKYDGDYLEDGSENTSKNIIGIVVKNTSSGFIQYGNLKFIDKNNEELEFEFSSIPSNGSIIVLEKNNKSFTKNNSYTYGNDLIAEIEDVSLMEDQVKIDSTDGIIEVKNISRKDISTAYIYYKQKVFAEDLPGSITYRIKLENIKSGESLGGIANHYSVDDSEIIMVDLIY